MTLEWSRREWLLAIGFGASFRPAVGAPDEAVVFPVELRKPGPYEALRRFITPGADEFAREREAMEIEGLLGQLLDTRAIPFAQDFEGASPAPAQIKALTGEIGIAEFDLSNRDFAAGLRTWLDGLRSVRFIALPDHRVRFEANSGPNGGRTGHWHMEWSEGRLRRFRPLDETRVTRAVPRLVDSSTELLGGSQAWRDQLARGVPYWRGRIDSASGIDIYGSNGISAGDIDNDGWDEIYVCQPGGLPNRLFKRKPDGAWDDIAATAGVDLLDNTSCALFIDFRNRGLQDLVVLRASSPLYFRNDGRGHFELVPEMFHFATPPQCTFTGMSAADYDNDGLVDLYFCTYVYFQSEDQYRYPVPYHDAQNGPPNFLMRNRLTHFEDVTLSSGINENNNRFSFAPVWCDYEGSGWPSLYVANDFGRNNLYRNRGGKFSDVASQAGVEDMGPGMCACWFDYDGDGRPDLYVANMWTPAGQRVVADPKFPNSPTPELKEAYRRHTKGNSLYRNRGDGTFEERPSADGAAVGRWTWGAEGIDFDNDGVPEILVACGMLTNSKPEDLMSFFWRQVVAKSPVVRAPAPEYEAGWNSINQYIREDYSWNGRERNIFYVRQDGRYHDCSAGSGFDWPDDSRTFAVTDVDGDGNLDVFLKSRLGPQVRVLRNAAGRERNSIAFHLRGTKSNRDAIGASVEIAGKRKFVQAGSGYLSQHTKRLYFGLDRDVVVTAHITWPSGTLQTFENLKAGHLYEITEGSAEIRRIAFQKSPTPPVGAELHGDNETGLSATWLLEPVPLPEHSPGPGFVLLTDGRHRAPTGFQVRTINLKDAPADTAAAYTLFRRYLFDWRVPLTTPLMILVDGESRAHKIYPSIPDAAVLRADLESLGAGGRQKLALPFAGRYVDPPIRNYYKLGAAFASAGYSDQALPYLQAALTQWPGNFKAWLAIGQVYLESNRPAEARVNLEKAIALNDASPEAWNNLGGVAIAEGRNDEALRCFEKMLSLAPDSVYGLTNAALALNRIGRKADAEKLYRRAIGIQPNDAETIDRLGLLLGQQGRLSEAIDLFKRALTIDASNASAINNLGVAYVESGRLPDATAAFDYGVRVAPSNDMMAMNLARLYVMQNQREKARETLRSLLQRNPNHAAARKALEQLGEP